MAAGKNETQPVVLEYRLLVIDEGILGVGLSLGRSKLAIDDLCPEQNIAANAVNCLVEAGIDEPCAGITRHPELRPLFDRGRKCLLLSLLGQVEIAEQAD